MVATSANLAMRRKIRQLFLDDNTPLNARQVLILELKEVTNANVFTERHFLAISKSTHVVVPNLF
jgi:hypothetical protein